MVLTRRRRRPPPCRPPSRSAGPSPARSTRRCPGPESATAAYSQPREDVFSEAARGDDFIGVTENGIATTDDNRQVDYYAGALEAVAAAIEDGINVEGCLAWSALDNYEWGSYRPTFGLIAIDPVTFERTAKPSAVWLGDLGPRPRTAAHGIGVVAGRAEFRPCRS